MFWFGTKFELIDEFMVNESLVFDPSVVEFPFTNKLPPTFTSPEVCITPGAVVATPTPKPPVRYPLPETDNVCAGDVEPIPKLPTWLNDSAPPDVKNCNP